MFVLEQVSSTVTLEELLPFTKAIATFKLPDYSSGKVRVIHESLWFSMGVNGPLRPRHPASLCSAGGAVLP